MFLSFHRAVFSRRLGYQALSAFLICILTFSSVETVLATAADRPNVILIMTDDQGWGDFGVQGNAIIRTPNLDAMSERSASMSNFYVCPVCTPTRAGLMTGRYNYRTRAIDTYIGRAMMDPAEVTVAEVLGEAGYSTGIFGKWHLGDCYPMRAMDQGFQESLIHRGGGIAQPSEPKANKRRYTDPILFRNGQQVETEGYCTDVYFEAALEFIEGAQKSGQPFFTYIATNAPHGPFHDVPEGLRKEYEQADMASIIAGKPKGSRGRKEVDTLARIAAMITNVDENVGRLFARLDDLGLTDNTMVIFLVDNGPNSRRFVGPYRGNKGGVNEGSVRSPLWVQWPARLKSGTLSGQISAHIDVMPTILDACGVENDAELDGRSLLPLLEGKEVDWQERTIATQWHRGDVPERYRHFMIRDNQWKLLNNSRIAGKKVTEKPEFELYDLMVDPGETNNLAEQKPEIVARLKAAYDRWFDDVGSTRPDNYAPPRIVIGSPKEVETTLTRQDWRSKDSGWHAGTMGHWVVTIAEAGRYEVQVILDDASTGGNIELHIGDKTLLQPAPGDSDSLLFAEVKIAAGDAVISATQTAGGSTRGAYQVIVRLK